MHIYDSLTQTKSKLTPIKANHITLYVCGMTVYDFCHIGHARSMIVFDMVVRYLRWRGYQVHYVRNITDIDDKIIQRAYDNNESWDTLAQRFIDAMHEDEQALMLLAPDQEPRATQYIPKMIALIERLIEQGYAYVTELGDVYYDVHQFSQYGKLSHRNLEQLNVGARIAVNEAKRNPLDFVLWKKAKPNEPKWASPWGEGRPGWHIECSVMSTDLLGQPFDIHGGGLDLKFPHHENEIAQSEAVEACDFAHLWMHAGLLQVDGEKMSKSLGNFYLIREVLAQYDAELIRYFMLSAHYRSPVNYTDANLSALRHGLDRLYMALRGMPVMPIVSTNTGEACEFRVRFIDAMEDDFNTPEALSVLFDLARHIQRLRESNKNDKAADYACQLKELAGTLMLLQKDPEVYFQGQASLVDVKKIKVLIDARQHARDQKNWQRADAIRKELMDMGITIEDTAKGTVWRQVF